KSRISATYFYEVQSGGSYVVRFCVAQPGRITGTEYWEPTSAPFTLCPPDGHFRPGLWRESGGRGECLPMALRNGILKGFGENVKSKKTKLPCARELTLFSHYLR